MRMADPSPLYLGFDLSTQQLKGIAVSSDLKVLYQAVFDFDADAAAFGIKKGVLTNEPEREVYAPVAMWLQAIDVVLQRLQDKGIDYARVKGISGAGSYTLESLFFPVYVPALSRKTLFGSRRYLSFRIQLVTWCIAQMPSQIDNADSVAYDRAAAWQCLLESRRRACFEMS